MDLLLISTLITGIIALISSMLSHIKSSKCFGEKGIDIQFNSENNLLLQK